MEDLKPDYCWGWDKGLGERAGEEIRGWGLEIAAFLLSGGQGVRKRRLGKEGR